jgi:hypothetical protein
MTVTVGGDETVTNGHASQRHRLSRVQIYSTVEKYYITYSKHLAEFSYIPAILSTTGGAARE